MNFSGTRDVLGRAFRVHGYGVPPETVQNQEGSP